MCGIVAMYSQGGVVERSRLEQATAVLNHRGPDARRHWLDETRRVGLGHTRLGIIDLDGGNQPLCNEDQSIHAVVNGELYDFERIRAELEARGHRFATGSDSEILIHLDEDHGASAVEKLRGEVAFVLYDAKNDVLLAGRDRFGIKPLHWAHVDGVLVLASEAKALFAAGLRARWDSESYFQATVLGGPLEDRTFFDGVYQVPPGHTLIATRHGIRFVRYWDFDYPVDGVGSSSDAEDQAALDAALDEAVRLRLRADVKVACYLSGGIDSAAILGLATRHASSPITAFTLAFDDDAYNEAPIAAEMAAAAGADYVPVAVGESDLARDLGDALWHAERPLNNGNSVARFRLSRAVREAGIKVVLTGEGSDEIFAGYPHFRRDLFLHQAAANPAAAADALGALERGNAVSRGILMPEGQSTTLGAVVGALGFAPTWLEAFSTAGQKVRGFLGKEFAAQFGARDPLALFVDSLEVGRQLAGRHPVRQSMYLWSKSVLPNYILSVLGDRMEMAHSVEGRLPFLDHHVVELARRLPIDRLIRGTTEKYLLREVARPVVTERIYRRQKHPFFAPPASTGPLSELMQDSLRGSALSGVPFFDQRQVIGLLDALPKLDEATRTAVDAPLMIVLSTCIMQRRFGLSV